LIAASVWIPSSIANRFGEVISRWSALTIPDVTVSCSPNGEPIATTPSPTCSAPESPSVSGWRIELGASIFTTARSVDGSVPTTVALYVAPPSNLTEMPVAPATTWSFVITWPFVS